MNPISPFKAIRQLRIFRGLTSKLGSLLLLFQRTPLLQMLFPEARLLGGAGLGEATKWTVTAIVGLGAFDTVAGATEISQVIPDSGSGEVPATEGEFLNFIVQVTGTPSTDQVSWSIDGLPPGLTHSELNPVSTHLISGIPVEVGETTITVTAWEEPNQTGASFSQEFLLIAAPPIIATQPASVTIASGGSTSLNVVANANGGSLSYRWFRGSSGTGTQISNAAGGNQSTLTLSGVTATTDYWVRVTRDGVVKNSNTATVSIATAPAITTQPVSTSIPSGSIAELSITTSGSTPAIQWYQGNSGITTNPVAGATSSVFTTPALTATTSYWARATNAAGFANSNTAMVTVTLDSYQEWRAAHFSPSQLTDPLVSGDSADPDGDARSNEDEYAFGTLPFTREGSPLGIAISNGNQVSLFFTAKLASGPGYAGKTRHYSLERRTELASGTWLPVAGYEDILGSNQTLNHVAPADPRAFYALRVWLSP